MFTLSPRQVHLDFHTTELISGIGADFDPEIFAQTAADAHVSSMTVFARCHHGWLYYDSKAFPNRVHPNLTCKNLVVDQVRALHAKGIKAPVYITVQWDYVTANEHPEWLIRKMDGSHEGPAFTEPGFYQSLCVNTGYIDYLKEITQEVCELLGDELDGIFFDITGIRPCMCAACRKEMAEKDIDMTDATAVRAFAKSVMDRFRFDMTAFVHALAPNCSIFYNGGHVGTGTKDAADAFTHFELESLPSGGWGYLHFPVTARYARKLGHDCMGMTGKFHTSWGDFHSLKNQAALEFEAFRMLSYGFACSIGDQLEPGGVLQPATYRLIGSVYKRFAECEAYARPSSPIVEAALVTAEDPLYENRLSAQLLGAAQMLEELSLQFDIVDCDMDLSPYKLVILSSDIVSSPAFEAKLNAYVKAGGKVIACGKGGLTAEGKYPASFGAVYEGEQPVYPDFIIPGGALTDGLEEDFEYTIYQQGVKLTPSADGKTYLTACAPYFKREGNRFCSHRYTPSAHGEAYPAAVGNDNVIVFAHPLFAQYRDCAPSWVKTIMKNAIRMMLGTQLVTHDGASTVSVNLLRKDDKTYAHILTYIPVRKSATIDIIEERTAAHNLTLTVTLPEGFASARIVPENIPLTVNGSSITLPIVDGYAIVELY